MASKVDKGLFIEGVGAVFHVKRHLPKTAYQVIDEIRHARFASNASEHQNAPPLSYSEIKQHFADIEIPEEIDQVVGEKDNDQISEEIEEVFGFPEESYVSPATSPIPEDILAVAAPDSPKRKGAEEPVPFDTPQRTKLAKILDVWNLDPTRKPRILNLTEPSASSSAAPNLVRKMTPRSSGFIRRLEGMKEEFFAFAKESSALPIQSKDFDDCFELIKKVFVKIDDTRFLENFVVRDSEVGVNKDGFIQEAFKAFEEDLANLEKSLVAIGLKSVDILEGVNFWSGRQGALKALEDPDHLSDSEIPMFKFLFACWGALRDNAEFKKEQPLLISALPVLFSTLFASYAKGVVHVYLSYQKQGKSCINVDSAFWATELYHLKQNPAVPQVLVHFFKEQDAAGKDVWDNPIDIKNDSSWRELTMLSRREDVVNGGISAADAHKMLKKWQSGQASEA